MQYAPETEYLQTTEAEINQRLDIVCQMLTIIVKFR